MWVPSVQDVLDVHHEVLLEGEGVPGVLQRGPLEAVIERTRWGPFESGDLSERAAYLVRGIASDHPFVDGNKRTAYQAVDLFLRENGDEIDAGKDEIIETMVSIARGYLDIEAIQTWIDQHKRKL